MYACESGVYKCVWVYVCACVCVSGVYMGVRMSVHACVCMCV